MGIWNYEDVYIVYISHHTTHTRTEEERERERERERTEKETIRKYRKRENPLIATVIVVDYRFNIISHFLPPISLTNIFYSSTMPPEYDANRITLNRTQKSCFLTI